MTNRFFRNALGVAALTSLALGLACSGSSDPEPSPSAPTVTKPGTPLAFINESSAIAKHRYTITINDPSNLATSFKVTATNGGAATRVTDNQWNYVPARSGQETVNVVASNSAGDSSPWPIVVNVRANGEPALTTAVTIPAGGFRNITLLASDSDGDAVTWTAPTVNNVTGSTGAAVVSGGILKVSFGIGANTGDKFTVKLSSTEKQPVIGHEVQTVQHTITVSVGAPGGGDDEVFDWTQGKAGGVIQSFPNNSDYVAMGVPFIFQFNATHPGNPDASITAWNVNGGISQDNAEGANAKPKETWIGQPMIGQPGAGGYFVRPAIGALGPEFERWRMAIDPRTRISNDDPRNYPGGKLFFVPTKDGNYVPDSYSAKVGIGVRSDFDSGVLAYSNFYVNVTENRPPRLVSGANYNLTGRDAFTITVLNKRKAGESNVGSTGDPREPSVPPEVPWAGKFEGSTKVAGVGVTYSSEPRLVFRHENNELSYDMAASIDLRSFVLEDDDFNDYGDVLTFMLDGVTYGDNRTTASGGASSRAWVDGTTPANSLKGSKFDVTSVVRPLLSRPYPVMGRDLDAARTWDKTKPDNYYVSGDFVNFYQDGVKQSIYGAHKGPEGSVSQYLGDTDYNARGNVAAVPSADGKSVTLQTLEFYKVPKVSDFRTPATGLRPSGITGNEGLTFHYTAIDLGGHSLPFEVYVPTRSNHAPVLDDYRWAQTSVGATGFTGVLDTTSSATGLVWSSGDVRGERLDPAVGATPDVWASSQPSENYKTEWGIVWSNDTTGKNVRRYFLADRPVASLAAATDNTGSGAGIWPAVGEQDKADPVYLMIPDKRNNADTEGKQVADRNTAAVNPVKGLEYNNLDNKMKAVSSTPWELAWTPTLYQGRNTYSYTIYGWDKYGAAMQPFEMKGRVFGSLTGTPITKSFYNNGEVVTAGPADLTINGFARVDVNLFFDSSYPTENKLSNMFGIDGDEPHLSINQRDVNAPWRTDIIPHDTRMMISAARTGAGSGAEISGPFIGPSVTSVDGTRVGTYFDSFDSSMDHSSKIAATYPTVLWETGNLISYAFMNPTQAEDPAASDATAPDPTKRIVLDLSANVGSGQLALMTDKSLNGTYGKADVYKVDVDLPLPWAQGGTFDYYGQMYGVGASGLGERGVIQIAMPSVGQSAFYHPSQSGSVPAGVDPFPSADYDSRLGWFNTPLASTSYKTSNSGLNFYPFVMPIFADDPDYAKYVEWVDKGTGGGSTLTGPAYGTGLPYTFHIGAEGSPSYTLVSLKKYPVDVKVGTAVVAADYPVWKMEKTGVPTRPKDPSILNFDNNDPDAIGTPLDTDMELTHESDWDDLKSNVVATFTAKVNRTSFADFLDRRVSRGVVADIDTLKTNVKDTLQVISYTSGTALGPVENHQGVPVFLEFGDINAKMGATYKFTGALDFGTFPIYEPTMWQTPFDATHSVPVASYIARYTDADTIFSGSMGFVDTVANIGTAGIALPTGFAPVSNVKITGGRSTNITAASAAIEWSGTPADNRQTHRGTAASEYISNYYSTSTTLGTVVAKPVYVKAFNDQQVAGGPKVNNDNYKVWLSWDNPAPQADVSAYPANKSKEYAPNISGNIIEFYDAADCAPSSVPLYKVYVGPSVTDFPIPDAWLPLLGYQGGTGAFTPPQASTMNAIVRIRTVRYGDKAKGTFVNFDKAPFRQALPAVWMDTLTTTLSFADVGQAKVKLEAEGAYNGFKKNGQAITGLPASIDLPFSAITGGSSSNLGAALTPANIEFPGTNPVLDASSLDVTWTAEYVLGSAGATLVKGDPANDTTPGSTATWDTAAITATFNAGQLAVNIPALAWSAAQPGIGTAYEDDVATVTFDILLTATYNAGANPRSATKTVTINLTNAYGEYEGFPDDATLTWTTPPSSASLSQDGSSYVNLTDITAVSQSIGPVVLAEVTPLTGTVTWAWAIDPAVAAPTVGGTNTGAVTPVDFTGITITGTNNNPTLAITASTLQGIVANLGTGSKTTTVTIPLKATITYEGKNDDQAARVSTATANVTFTFTGPTT